MDEHKKKKAIRGYKIFNELTEDTIKYAHQDISIYRSVVFVSRYRLSNLSTRVKSVFCSQNVAKNMKSTTYVLAECDCGCGQIMPVTRKEFMKRRFHKKGEYVVVTENCYKRTRRKYKGKVYKDSPHVYIVGLR